jgi:hypothetical protein
VHHSYTQSITLCSCTVSAFRRFTTMPAPAPACLPACLLAYVCACVRACGACVCVHVGCGGICGSYSRSGLNLAEYACNIVTTLNISVFTPYTGAIQSCTQWHPTQTSHPIISWHSIQPCISSTAAATVGILPQASTLFTRIQLNGTDFVLT